MLYCAPLPKLITVGAVMPVMVMGVAICVLERAEPIAFVKLACNTGSAPVVTAKLAGSRRVLHRLNRAPR